ncbi:MAG: 4-(cytidine 5'-diphospho)-2-C-methyl-D-erythritol kinase [Gemmatimonadaceae bacterium]
MTARAAHVTAQAKLNLHLRVLSREASGFHSIETIFHRIDLADDLVIRPADAGRTLDVEGGDLGPMEENLAWRAATAYTASARWPRGFRIELTKHIPVGAGLGGGSADAAGVLRALDFLSPNPLGATELWRLAASLGADVAFLAGDAVMALAWGRGERMLALKALPQRDVLLVSPREGVATAEAYGWLDQDRTHAESATDEDSSKTPVITLDELASWDSIASFAINDFEPPVFARVPSLSDELDRLRSAGVILARMTGSGSTLFGIAGSATSIDLVAPTGHARVTRTATAVRVVSPVRVD